jgi:3-dehydroquinate dehydratase type I
MSGLFCIPIVASTTAQALEKMGQACDLADVLEVRLDAMAEFDLQAIMEAASKPVLVTCRSRKEGGRGCIGPERQARLLLTAIDAGAAFVDVEFSLPAELRRELLLNRKNSKIILSTHRVTDTPSLEELASMLKSMENEKADVVKIVTRARHWEDNLRVLNLLPQAQEYNINLIAFCMGPLGRISRIFSHLMGGYMSFASLNKGEESAEGQIPIRELKLILEALTS